ncbi:unnamed protein product [Amoebophrya sp. A25]|nr:unnamed protein product [Amoebophrya sp. A25]|eukprot:GSA25T00026844001.1
MMTVLNYPRTFGQRVLVAIATLRWLVVTKSAGTFFVDARLVLRKAGGGSSSSTSATDGLLRDAALKVVIEHACAGWKNSASAADGHQHHGENSSSSGVTSTYANHTTPTTHSLTSTVPPPLGVTFGGGYSYSIFEADQHAWCVCPDCVAFHDDDNGYHDWNRTRSRRPEEVQRLAKTKNAVRFVRQLATGFECTSRRLAQQFLEHKRYRAAEILSQARHELHHEDRRPSRVIDGIYQDKAFSRDLKEAILNMVRELSRDRACTFNRVHGSYTTAMLWQNIYRQSSLHHLWRRGSGNTAQGTGTTPEAPASTTTRTSDTTGSHDVVQTTCPLCQPNDPDQEMAQRLPQELTELVYLLGELLRLARDPDEWVRQVTYNELHQILQSMGAIGQRPVQVRIVQPDAEGRDGVDEGRDVEIEEVEAVDEASSRLSDQLSFLHVLQEEHELNDQLRQERVRRERVRPRFQDQQVHQTVPGRGEIVGSTATASSASAGEGSITTANSAHGGGEQQHHYRFTSTSSSSSTAGGSDSGTTSAEHAVTVGAERSRIQAVHEVQQSALSSTTSARQSPASPRLALQRLVYVPDEDSTPEDDAHTYVGTPHIELNLRSGAEIPSSRELTRLVRDKLREREHGSHVEERQVGPGDDSEDDGPSTRKEQQSGSVLRRRKLSFFPSPRKMEVEKTEGIRLGDSSDFMIDNDKPPVQLTSGGVSKHQSQQHDEPCPMDVEGREDGSCEGHVVEQEQMEKHPNTASSSSDVKREIDKLQSQTPEDDAPEDAQEQKEALAHDISRYMMTLMGAYCRSDFDETTFGDDWYTTTTPSREQAGDAANAIDVDKEGLSPESDELASLLFANPLVSPRPAGKHQTVLKSTARWDSCTTKPSEGAEVDSDLNAAIEQLGQDFLQHFSPTTTPRGSGVFTFRNKKSSSEITTPTGCCSLSLQQSGGSASSGSASSSGQTQTSSTPTCPDQKKPMISVVSPAEKHRRKLATRIRHPILRRKIKTLTALASTKFCSSSTCTSCRSEDCCTFSGNERATTASSKRSCKTADNMKKTDKTPRTRVSYDDRDEEQVPDLLTERLFWCRGGFKRLVTEVIARTLVAMLPRQSREDLRMLISDMLPRVHSHRSLALRIKTALEAQIRLDASPHVRAICRLGVATLRTKLQRLAPPPQPLERMSGKREM